jgi:hypothetical protein
MLMPVSNGLPVLVYSFDTYSFEIVTFYDVIQRLEIASKRG